MLFTYISIGIIPLVIFINALIGTVERYYEDQKVIYLQRQSNILSSQLTLANYLDGQNIVNGELIEFEINQLSKELDGRVLIVNKDHVVIKDTNQVEEGKTLISQEAVRGLGGETFIRHIKERQRMQVVTPIKNNDLVIGTLIITASTEDIYDSVKDLRNKSILLFIITLLIILTISYYYSELLTRPFKDLFKHIKSITAGHFNENSTVKGHQEIEDISIAFNQMTRKLQEFEQSRQEFVSNVSHELKTPLASIKVLADSLLSQKDVPAELYREFLLDISNEVDREDKIINDLLSLVKMDKKEVKLNVEQVNINMLIEQILKRLKPLAEKQDVELIFESFREVVGEIDEVKLSLALTNIIENGIKYNKESGWVKISLNADHKFFFVKITDSGIGIPKDEQDKIFQRFYRIDKARSRETGGTGLGLSITKNAIIMHKGFINVKSEEGEGTTFSLRIPLYYQ